MVQLAAWLSWPQRCSWQPSAVRRIKQLAARGSWQHGAVGRNGVVGSQVQLAAKCSWQHEAVGSMVQLAAYNSLQISIKDIRGQITI